MHEVLNAFHDLSFVLYSEIFSRKLGICRESSDFSSNVPIVEPKALLFFFLSAPNSFLLEYFDVFSSLAHVFP